MDIGINIFLKKYCILMFSAETTSHKFCLNITRGVVTFWDTTIQDSVEMRHE